MTSLTPDSSCRKCEQIIGMTSNVDDGHLIEMIEDIHDVSAQTQEKVPVNNNKKRSQIEEDKRRKFVVDAFEEKFVVPAIAHTSHKDNMVHPFLLVYPELKDAIIDFADTNIGDISVELMHTFINKCIKIIVDNESIFVSKIERSEDDKSDAEEDSDDNTTESSSQQSSLWLIRKQLEQAKKECSTLTDLPSKPKEAVIPSKLKEVKREKRLLLVK